MNLFRWFLLCIRVNAGPVAARSHHQQLVCASTVFGIPPKPVLCSPEHTARISGRDSVPEKPIQWKFSILHFFIKNQRQLSVAFCKTSFSPKTDYISLMNGLWKLGTIQPRLNCSPTYPLSHVFKPHPESHPDHSLNVLSKFSVPPPMYPPPKAVNPKDVEYIIKRLPQKKAPGFDLITPRILHHLPPQYPVLYSAILRKTYFLTSWKFDIILMIPKTQNLALILPSY